jgi:hypothetical protein
MEKALQVVNQLESEGVIGRYAIGGAVAMIYYTEPTHTRDLDIFCYLPSDPSQLIVSLNPVYERLRQIGFAELDEEGVNVDGTTVQFLSPPPNSLEQEALDNAKETFILDIPTRIFGYEYLLAIACDVGRYKDKARIAEALGTREPDNDKLNDILKRYQLLDKWRKIDI